MMANQQIEWVYWLPVNYEVEDATALSLLASCLVNVFLLWVVHWMFSYSLVGVFKFRSQYSAHFLLPLLASRVQEYLLHIWWYALGEVQHLGYHQQVIKVSYPLQIRRSLLNEDESGFRRAKRPVYYDEGLEVTTFPAPLPLFYLAWYNSKYLLSIRILKSRRLARHWMQRSVNLTRPLTMSLHAWEVVGTTPCQNLLKLTLKWEPQCNCGHEQFNFQISWTSIYITCKSFPANLHCWSCMSGLFLAVIFAI